jgi:hypothetical protein
MPQKGGRPPPPKPSETALDRTEPTKADSMETARRIMKRLADTPYEPHKPLRKGSNRSAATTPRPKERPASKGRVHKGKTRS